MSNDHTHVGSLMNDLVQMAQATARLPELERELREMREALNERNKRIEFLETKIEGEVAINTELAAKLHAAEVARDDAGFRQLEAEDRAAALRNAIENVFPALAKTLAALDSDGNDVVMRTNTTELHEFQTYRDKQAEDARKAAEEAAKPVDPIPATSDTVISTSPSTAPGSEVGNTSGQREPDPTGVSSGATPSPSAEPSAPLSTSGYIGAEDPTHASGSREPPKNALYDYAASSTTAASTEGVSVSQDPTASQPTSPSETVHGTTAPEQAGVRTGKYSNHRYADWPYYVSEAGWIEGGGTHESYWDGRGQWANPATA